MVPGLVLGTEVGFSPQESLAFCKSINIKVKGLREPAPLVPCLTGQKE